MYTVTQGTFRTPRGRAVTMAYRTDTNDWNTLNACMAEDEYSLKDLTLTGMALDIGAHIGGVTIGLAIDNPDLRIVAVEAVPPNVELLRQNVEANGLSDRVTVLHAAAGEGETATIRWAFAGNESADHHAFIGNAVMPETDLRVAKREQVPVRTLDALVEEFGPFAFAKVDAEGAEYPFLKGDALSQVALIRGEYHFGIEPLKSQLQTTHTVTFGDTAPGPFEAVRRA